MSAQASRRAAVLDRLTASAGITDQFHGLGWLQSLQTRAKESAVAIIHEIRREILPFLQKTVDGLEIMVIIIGKFSHFTIFN